MMNFQKVLYKLSIILENSLECFWVEIIKFTVEKWFTKIK